jgi:hypothetical protein
MRPVRAGTRGLATRVEVASTHPLGMLEKSLAQNPWIRPKATFSTNPAFIGTHCTIANKARPPSAQTSFHITAASQIVCHESHVPGSLHPNHRPFKTGA